MRLDRKMLEEQLEVELNVIDNVRLKLYNNRVCMQFMRANAHKDG